MTRYVALLRAVNVGGTGKLSMADLKAAGELAGFNAVRTYIASGNLLLTSALAEAAVRDALEQALAARTGSAARVIVRDAAALEETVRRNPFADRPPATTVALFVDTPLDQSDLARARNRNDEELALGPRTIYIAYGAGMGRSRLVVPAAAHGTARNIRTVTALAALAAG